MPERFPVSRIATPILCIVLAVTAIMLGSVAVQAGELRDLLWQTNADGDDIHIYDIETGERLRRLAVGANPHGIATTPQSDIVFVSLERNGQSSGELLWIDKASFEITARLEVGPEPHAIAITDDGRWVFVPCRDGHYWVVDTERREVVDRIRTGGRPHNTTVSPDGLVLLSPMGEPERATLVDPRDGHKVVGEIPFSASLRPPAVAPSLGLLFQHVDGLNGFEVADISHRENIARITHATGLGVPIRPASLGFLGFAGLSRCHGLAVRPGDEEVWSVCGAHATIHSTAAPGFPERATIDLPGKGYWLTFSPDGRHAFIALSDRSEVAMVDATSKDIIRILKAGQRPKRNLVIPTDLAARQARSAASTDRRSFASIMMKHIDP
ncbi:cytochrome D1 domain-containing protein [Parvibaculum sp.]|uniref:YncE family protein n=1 Tax=Parvibaculum sp. TaxID=2024848 RepID=UPI00349FF47D